MVKLLMMAPVDSGKGKRIKIKIRIKTKNGRASREDVNGYFSAGC